MLKLALSGSYMPASVAAALILHVVAVLGLQIIPEPRRSTSQMEVVLASFRHDSAPDEADFLAQENQLGSGTEDEKRLLTTTEQAPFPHNLPQQLSALPAPPHQQEQAHAVAIASRPLPGADADEARRERQQENTDPGTPREQARLSQQIASLEAKLDAQRQQYAKKPRVRRFTSLSTKSSVDAHYQLVWQQLVEQVGNANYPAEARRRQLEGDVRLLVALRPDGSIQDIQLLGSSGYRELDQAAIRSVQLAAPFEPFPREIRANTDILEIVRTWQFRRNFLTSS